MHNTSQYIPIHPIHARRFANVVDSDDSEMLELTNREEYLRLFPSQITKATLNKGIFECIVE